MTSSRPKCRLAAAMIVAGATLFCPLAAYVGGYFFLGEVHVEPGLCVRGFEHNWLVPFFGPMGWLEAKTSGDAICLFGDNLNDRIVHTP